MLTPGSKIGGFLIGDLLGKGAMGEVYKGEQLSLKRPVAVKRIATHLLENEDMVKRFKREAQVLAKVGHPNVVGVIECEEFLDAAGEKNLLLIMELIEGGRSLKAHLGKPIDWRLATCVVRMCADGLAAAFEQQVVHRDIKPDNIMMTRKGIAKLVDFGLAKAAESTALTMQAAPMGTPLFMSPEACRGEEIGHAGDLYSLGVSWWFMLTGQYPFQAANLHGLLFKHISDPLPPPTGLFDHVPPPIVKLVYQCLEKDPANRPASAVKLVEAIESLPAQGLLIPRDARELVGAGTGGNAGGSTTAGTMVAPQAVDRTAATMVSGAASKTAATMIAGNAKTIAGDLSPQGAVAATVVANLAPESVPDHAATAPTAVPPAKSGGKGGLIAAVVIAVVLLGGAGAWFATRSNASTPTQTAQTPAPSPQPALQPVPVPVVTPTPGASTNPLPTQPPEPTKPADPKPEPPVVTPVAPAPVPVVTPPADPPKPVVAPPPTEPPKPVVEPPKPAVEPPPEQPKPVPPPKPAPPAVVDTSAFDTALAGKDWQAAKAAAEALPEPARGDARLKLTKAANQQLRSTMRTAKGLFDAARYDEASGVLAADVPVAPLADDETRQLYIRLSKLVRDTAKAAQEQP